jgi:hypothetical protein
MAERGSSSNGIIAINSRTVGHWETDLLPVVVQIRWAQQASGRRSWEAIVSQHAIARSIEDGQCIRLRRCVKIKKIRNSRKSGESFKKNATSKRQKSVRFERMNTEELEAYAVSGTQPSWFPKEDESVQ